MRLKSLSTFPPNGFVYRQPETGWQSAFGRTFRETCEDIQNHRLANPRFNLSTDLDTIAGELEAYTCARLQHMAGASQYCTEGGDPFQEARLQAGQAQAEGFRGVAVIDRAKKAVAGIGILLDWLGPTGGSVPDNVVESRAAICAICPKNVTGDLFQRLEARAAELLRKQLQLRTDMKLSTSIDDKLNTCDGCDCSLKLKVHVPLPHIWARTREEIWPQLDPKCWMLAENAKQIEPEVVK